MPHGPDFAAWLSVHGPRLGNIVPGSTGAVRGEACTRFLPISPIGRRSFAMWRPRSAAAMRFLRHGPRAALSERRPRRLADCPAVTILKPLHGLEPNLYANLAGFCAQDYPSPVQIVFGVDDPADPAVARRPQACRRFSRSRSNTGDQCVAPWREPQGFEFDQYGAAKRAMRCWSSPTATSSSRPIISITSLPPWRSRASGS